MSRLFYSETTKQRTTIQFKPSVKPWVFFGWFIITFLRLIRSFYPHFSSLSKSSVFNLYSIKSYMWSNEQDFIKLCHFDVRSKLFHTLLVFSFWWRSVERWWCARYRHHFLYHHYTWSRFQFYYSFLSRFSLEEHAKKYTNKEINQKTTRRPSGNLVNLNFVALKAKLPPEFHNQRYTH